MHFSNERPPQQINRPGAEPQLAGDPCEDVRRGVLHARHWRGHGVRCPGRRLHHTGALGHLAQAARPRARQRGEYSACPRSSSLPTTPRFRCAARVSARVAFGSATAASANTPAASSRPRKGNIDHVVPRSRGGKTSWDNCVLAHREVNSRKANRLPDEAGLHLRKQPVAPPALHRTGMPCVRFPP